MCNSSLSISLRSTTKVSSTIGTIVRGCPARSYLEPPVAASSFPSVVSRKARAFQPAAETRDGEHTLRLLALKSDQGRILCVTRSRAKPRALRRGAFLFLKHRLFNVIDHDDLNLAVSRGFQY